MMFTLTVAAAIFAMSFYDVVINNAKSADIRATFQLFKDNIDSAGDFLARSDVLSNASLFIIWAIIGSIAYILFWIVVNIAVDLYNDIVISSAFVHPKSFHQSSYWLSIISRGVLRATALILIIIYMFIWSLVFYPSLFDLIKQNLQIGFGLHSVWGVLVAVVTAVVSLHIFAILIRLFALKIDINEKA